MNIYFGKQRVKLKKDFAKVSRVGLLFDFNLQYRSICATFKLVSVFVWFCFANRIIITQRQYSVQNCREKQQKLATLWQKRYFKNKVKHVMSLLRSWKRLSEHYFGHKTVKTNDKIRRLGVVMTPFSRKNVFNHAYFPAHLLCRVIKGWLSTALGLVSRHFSSCSLPP